LELDHVEKNQIAYCVVNCLEPNKDARYQTIPVKAFIVNIIGMAVTHHMLSLFIVAGNWGIRPKEAGGLALATHFT
jgi:hypothetical protein